MITRKFLLLASMSGFITVLLGAFGAHLLKKILTEYEVHIFETGVQYQFYHTFALLIVAMLGRYLNERWVTVAGWLFVLGIFFFSGSLYLLSVVSHFGMESSIAVLGPMTPIGGLFFMGGWLAMFRAAFDYKKASQKRSSGSKDK